MARAVIYCRVSKEDPLRRGESLGLEAQESACREYCARNGLDVASVHRDEGVGGAVSLKDRPGLFAAVQDLDRGSVLVVAKRDRLARDVFESCAIERAVERRRASVMSASEPTNGSDPTSELMRRMLDAFSAYERLVIGARTKAGLRAKRARGELAGGVPYGYRAEGPAKKAKLVPIPEEQETLALMRHWRAEGWSLRKIAAELDARGIPRRGIPWRGSIRRGARWQSSSVYSILLHAEA